MSSDNIGKIPNNLKISEIITSFPKAQYNKLIKILMKNTDKRVAIYSSSILKCISLKDALWKDKFDSINIHSGIESNERLAQYFDGRVDGKVLIFNEIIAINFDFKADIVVFYDFPKDLKSFSRVLGTLANMGRILRLYYYIKLKSKNLGN